MKTLTTEQKNLILLLIFVGGGIFGFLYEEIFYWIDLGYLVKRGITFGPWIPIYGFGAILIVLTTDKLRHRPILLLLTAMSVCGTLEFLTGIFLYYVFQVRLWDYNIESWNWLNLGGFVCLRSVLFFGLSALFLQYIAYPIFEKIANKCEVRTLKITAFVSAGLFAGDIAISVICKLMQM